LPTFCRHGRFIERCVICSRDLPVALGGAAAARAPSERKRAPAGTRSPGTRQGLRVRRETRFEDDGYRSALVPGLRSSEDAARLAGEIGFASGRLLVLESEPPGCYGEVARSDDAEQAAWLAFLIAYLSPLEGEDPFAGIRAAATDWHSGDLPDLEGVALGPRTSHDPRRGLSTLVAYRQWVGRAGSQALAYGGDADWSPERRFERIFERLALPGLGRVGRYDLLVTLGCLGRFPLRASSLRLGGEDQTTLAAKRVFGIGENLLLERRAAALAEAAQVPVQVLDVALANWAAEGRVALGVDPDVDDDEARERAGSALGL
jgi:hypothetical protein